ncbi:MAG: cell division protein SepF [Actinobacteria bacterium]|nr:cell division protein SepF [Actinomycetota bacterium]MDQ3532001.1 cell division protein SepF [Actinomycetota bacterium]
MPSLWTKTLIYLGLAEDEDEEYDEPGTEEETSSTRRSASVRRIADSPSSAGKGAVVRVMPPTPAAKFHLVHPYSFNDAQEVGDKFREGFSVLMNLQAADSDLSRRLVDFASGLAYGLNGSLQPVADKVFLITPNGVQVSAEERRRFLEERGFYNQA